MKRLLLKAAASLAAVVILGGAAPAQTPRLPTEGLHPGMAPVVPLPTEGYHPGAAPVLKLPTNGYYPGMIPGSPAPLKLPSAGVLPGRLPPVVNTGTTNFSQLLQQDLAELARLRQQLAALEQQFQSKAGPVRPTPPAPAAPKAPANRPVAGTWQISTPDHEFGTFNLVIDSVDAARSLITYHSTLDSRPHVGHYNPLTGFVQFTHEDFQNRRDFSGRIMQDKQGRWVLNGTYQIGDGVWGPFVDRSDRGLGDGLDDYRSIPLIARTFFGIRVR